MATTLNSSRVMALTHDLSKDMTDSQFDLIRDFNPDIFIHCAGGGPYGLFHEKKFKSHEWALRVNLLSYMQITHTLLNQKPRKIMQMIAVGSSIAESQPDPGAASYSTAKHALLGFSANLRAEYPEIDIRVFSPGYMNTPMLPAQKVIELGQKCLKVDEVAQHFVRWMVDPMGSKHFTLNPS